MQAVRQNGNALRYVSNQTPEICIEAVRQNGNALRYVLNKIPEIYAQVRTIQIIKIPLILTPVWHHSPIKQISAQIKRSSLHCLLEENKEMNNAN